jgi:hypothetical protein
VPGGHSGLLLLLLLRVRVRMRLGLLRMMSVASFASMARARQSHCEMLGARASD